MSQSSGEVLAPPVESENVSIFRVVMAAVLIALVWKFRFFLAVLAINQRYPLKDDFFPTFFQSPLVMQVAWLTTCACAATSLFARQKRGRLVAVMFTLLSLLVLCVHQLAFNDVTFLCCAWSSIWAAWFASRIDEPHATLFPRAAWLAALILSMIFWGGAVGKMTDEYWSGKTLFEIYFRERDFWTYNLARRFIPEDALPAVAMWHSRMVVVAEILCSFLWLMPRKIASAAAIIMLCGIALTNNISLFSVVSSLLGLAVIGLHDPKLKTDRHMEPFAVQNEPEGE